MTFKDRVQKLVRVPAGEIAPNPKNWRTHSEAQKAALTAVLEEVGFAGATLVRELPEPDQNGRKYMLIDGHLRTHTARDQEIPCLVVDLSDEEADKVLATFDPIGALAGTNHEALASLLGSVAENSGQAMKSLLADVAKEYKLPTMADTTPEDVPAGNYSEQYGVVVVCDGEEHQREVYESLRAHGYNCKVVVT